MPSPVSSDSVDETLSAIDDFAIQHESAWIAYRRERHCSPEPSGEETTTSHSVCARLKSIGISAVIPQRGVGVVGDLLLGSATERTPAIAVRADIDALRMPDRKVVDYASIHEGMAHACGHDVHTTVVLGVAETLTHLIRQERAVPSARIRFVFQAAEETGEGAEWMIGDGFLDGVESILGLHVEPNLLAGQIGVRYGVFTAGVDEVLLTVRGRGGHTARPHSTTDPIHAAVMLVSALYQWLPRKADVREPSVFTVGQIHGGFAPNVIPDEVTIAGTLRTTDPSVRATLIEQLEFTCQQIGLLTGNEIQIQYPHSLGSVINSKSETQAFEKAGRDALGNDSVIVLDQPSMGGEDFAAYMSRCTGSQIRLGCATSIPWPHLHSPVFDVDERCITVGVRVLTRAVLNLAEYLHASTQYSTR
ncbi:MAG: amidohydrolase [Planctomycetaceae bacterium]